VSANCPANRWPFACAGCASVPSQRQSHANGCNPVMLCL
jgi:hypothetical protein